MAGRTWKGLEEEEAKEIRSLLMDYGGVEQEAKGAYEVWRVRFSDSTFTHYETGSLYSSPSSAQDPAVFEVWQRIDSLVGSQYVPPTRQFLVGLDETGKGEVIGHAVLTGAILPQQVFQEIDQLIGPANTKERRTFEYWDRLFASIDHLRSSGLDFIVETVPPWHVDRYNLNRIMDVSYQRVLSILLRRVEPALCRITVDDYGVGETLGRYLRFLERQGAEVYVLPKADDQYLEAKVASLVAKRQREAQMKAINKNIDFHVDGLSVGSGNAGDKATREWLEKWYRSGQGWPWFVKRSFKTVREIEGKKGKVRKRIPPLRDELLSRRFMDEFDKGNLSIQALSLVCPDCGSILNNATFAAFVRAGQRVSGLKCPTAECSKLGRIIEDAGITLRYYCGYVVPDSSAVWRNLISDDLGRSKFFEDFTVVLDPVVRKECDGTPRAKREFDELAKQSAKGRITVRSVGAVEDIPEDLPSPARDERIIRTCLEYNAMLLTADKSMRTFAIGKEVFTISTAG